MDDWRINHRLEKIFNKYPELDDPNWLISVKEVEIYRTVNQYADDLKKLFLETLISSGVNKISKETMAEFNNIMRAYAQRAKRLTLTQKDLLREIINQYHEFYTGVVDDIKKRSIQKAVSLRTQARLQAIPRNYEKSILGNVLTLWDGEKIMSETLKNTYKNMEKRYGTRMTIRYGGDGPNGKNYPLTSYLDARQATTNNQVARMTSQIMAANQGVYTFKIDFNGTTDSCKFWEGKIGFYSDAAKQAFLAEFPNYPEAARWPTLQYLQDVDRTHIFKFNCRHGALPYPIQYFDESDQKAAVLQNNPPEIPDKINERQIEEETRTEALTTGDVL